MWDTGSSPQRGKKWHQSSSDQDIFWGLEIFILLWTAEKKDKETVVKCKLGTTCHCCELTSFHNHYKPSMVTQRDHFALLAEEPQTEWCSRKKHDADIYQQLYYTECVFAAAWLWCVSVPACAVTVFIPSAVCWLYLAAITARGGNLSLSITIHRAMIRFLIDSRDILMQ